MARQTLLAVCVCLALLACSAFAAPERLQGDCVSKDAMQSGLNLFREIQSSSVTFFPDHTKVQVATNFRVEYYSTVKVVTHTGKNETYLLYQCGTDVPKPADYGLPESTKTFAIPLTAISVPDTGVVAFMKPLGILDRVAYVTEYAIDSCMQSLASPPCNRTDSKADKSAIDAVFGPSSPASNPLGIAFSAADDPGPLNRAEYIKYMAAFFNKESLANTLFNQTVARYEAIKAAAAKAAAGSPPLVAWIGYRPSNPDWKKYDARPQGWAEAVQLYFTDFRKAYTEDAGGRLHDPAALIALYGDNENITYIQEGAQKAIYFFNLTTTYPTLREILKDVDVVVDETYYPKQPKDVTLDDFRKSFALTDTAALTDLRFMRAQQILRTDGSSQPLGSTAWFEDAVAQPDQVLHDLVMALLPNALSGAGLNAAPPKLMRSLFAGDKRVMLSEPSQCPLQACALPRQAICPALYKDCSGKWVAATDAQPCAPTCPTTGAPSSSNPAGPSPGAAGRVSFVPTLLLAAAMTAMAAILGFAL